MKINCHNTFDPLQEVILGAINETVVDTVENPNKRSILLDVVHDTIEDLNNLQTIFENAGVKVHRPNTNIDFSQTLKTPYWESAGSHVPLTPRDIFCTYDNTLLITNAPDRNRYFEYHCYEEIIENYFDHGSHIVSMPFNSCADHVYENIQEDHAYFNNRFPMIAAANIQKYGKDIFASPYLTANSKGIEWLKRQMGDEYRWHFTNQWIKGHVDAVFNILRPGVVLSHLPKNLLPDYFSNWEVITFDNRSPQRLRGTSPDLISENIQDDDFEGTFLALNAFSIDQSTVLLAPQVPLEIITKVEKQGFDIVFAELQHNCFLNQGFTCVALDTVRKGTLEDYSD